MATMTRKRNQTPTVDPDAAPQYVNPKRKPKAQQAHVARRRRLLVRHGFSMTIARRLSVDAMRCECGQEATGVASFVVMPCGHAIVQYIWICSDCAAEADEGITIQWL